MDQIKEFTDMPKIELAKPTPFDEGLPRINAPGIYGSSPKKPFLYRIPATGERPLSFSIKPSLPKGLVLDEGSGMITGVPEAPGRYELLITAVNRHGGDSKKISLHITDEGSCLTPLMGWTSWNAFAWEVDQEKIIETAELMVSLGLSSYGYQYVNIDSSWQGEYGGRFGAIMPNHKFSDMAGVFRKIHSLGLKGGIYSTPMIKAWGLGKLSDKIKALPGCTLGEKDMDHPSSYYPIGIERREENNVRQWCEWGVDYLKYDWSPTDKENAEAMKKHLLKADRDIPFCVTVQALFEHIDYWKKNCCSYRNNPDSADNWDTLKKICFGADKWSEHTLQGHYFDLDMLETGYIMDLKTGIHRSSLLTEDEQLTAFSARALFPSPIQLSCDLTKFTDFDKAMCCNEEVIAVNQDTSGCGAVCISETIKHDEAYNLTEHTKIYKRKLEDGSSAVGFFNIGEKPARMSIPLQDPVNVRDLWAKRSLGVHKNELSLQLEPHTVRLLKLSKI